MNRKQKNGKAGIDNVIGRAVGAAGSVLGLGRSLGSALGLPGLGRESDNRPRPQPGAAPGIENLPDVSTPPPPDAIEITCTTWNADRVETRTVEDLDAFLWTPWPEWSTVRWINVNGLHPYVVNRFREAFEFHTLAAEDVLFVRQRPKTEVYDNCLFAVARMLTAADRRLQVEQVSFFLLKDTVITFQERPGDVWEPIRARINQENTKLRTGNADYLLYALIDAVVDHCFPILEGYGDLLEELEEEAIENPTPELLQRLHAIKRELSLLRRVLWPTRDMVDSLYRDEADHFSAATAAYLRDVYDHTVQVIDIIETYREMAGSLTDLYMSGISNRMNEIMKVLTIMASLFIPVTFLAGIYGMNFKHMPELDWKISYPLFWVVTISIVTGLLIYFRRKKWI